MTRSPAASVGPATRVLGIDPGSECTGWGLVAESSGGPVLVDCGLIRPRATEFAVRLGQLQAEVEQLLLRLAPDCAAVESPFHGVSPRSSLQLAHARGVILAALARAGVEVAEYSPATVKKAVTGNGRAEKGQVRGMIGRLLAAPMPARADVSDALAVSLCHVTSRRFLSAVDRAR